MVTTTLNVVNAKDVINAVNPATDIVAAGRSNGTSYDPITLTIDTPTGLLSVASETFKTFPMTGAWDADTAIETGIYYSEDRNTSISNLPESLSDGANSNGGVFILRVSKVSVTGGNCTRLHYARILQPINRAK